MDIVVRRMPELGCTPDVISCSTLLKGLCDEKRTQEALELLRMMVDGGGSCMPNVVSYNTVIDDFSKEGEVDKANSLLFVNVVTYSSIIDDLCKAQAMNRAEGSFHRCLIKVLCRIMLRIIVCSMDIAL